MAKRVTSPVAGQMGEGDKHIDNRPIHDKLIDRLIGEANEAGVKVGGIETTALIDSGSMVTCVSERFYKQLDTKYELRSITDFDLHVHSADGSQLPFMGYIEVDISAPCLGTANIELCVPVLVTPDTEYNHKVPVVIGTNVIRLYRQMALQADTKCDIPTAWNTAFEAMSANKSVFVTCTNKRTLAPGEVTTLHGLVRKTDSMETAVTEPTETGLAGGCTVCPRVVSLNKTSGKTVRVPVRVCNLSARPVTILPKAALCSLSEVKVVDTWNPSNQVKTHRPVKEDNEIPTPEKLGVGINTDNISESQLSRVRQLLHKWDHIFSKSVTDLGNTDTVKHAIRLTSDDPFKDRYRRVPPAMFEEVRQHLKEMLESGAIRKSESPYSSNVVLVRKKDGSLRFCIDFRKLNNLTVKDAYSLPRVDEALDTLTGARLFSKLDLRSGYWQVELREEDKAKTAFSVGPLGFYECNRMAFGLTNACATFQRLMETCMGELNLRECLVFIDDILIYSADFDEHLIRLENVFQKLHQYGLKLKPSKCELFMSHVKYLGHVVSEAGIHTDPDKISALTTWPVPSSVKTLRSFLGFTGYYRRFVKNYARIVKPLNDLLIGHPTNRAAKKSKRKSTPWVWGEKQQQAFETIIERLTSPPTLGYADFSKEFIVNTDASLDGLGAVLYQVQDGKERVIAYASRGLRASEKNYAAHKLEFLCLKWALSEKFHDYLYGNQFVVRTDNNPLTYVTKTAKLDATGHRWVAALASYNFKLVYRSGTANRDADGLSRRPHPTEQTEMFHDVVRAICSAALVSRQDLPFVESVLIADADETPLVADQERTIETNELGKIDWQREQAADESLSRVIHLLQRGIRPKWDDLRHESSEVQRYVREWSKLIFRDSVLYRTTTLDGEVTQQLVLPHAFRHIALKGCHDDIGHQGRDRTMWLIRQRFYWPGMDKEVREKVEHCGRCIRRKTRPRPSAELVSIQSSRPMELVCMDYLTLERSAGGYENILVITDHFTRYAQAIPTRNQTAKSTAKALYENFVCHYSFPARLHSDQGRNFESSVIKELCELANVKKTRTTPYHPMGNGMVERFNQTLINMLGTLETSQKSDWKSYVAPLVNAYNSTKNETTGYSPHYLMFGWHPRLAVDAYLGLDKQSDRIYSRENYAQKLRKRLQFAYKVAAKEAEKNQGRYKGYYDRKVRESTLEVGDRVLVRNVGLKGKNKLADKWEQDPYIVIKIPNKDTPVYQVQKESGNGRIRTLHRNLLLPFMHIPCSEPKESRKSEPCVIRKTRQNTGKNTRRENDSETEDASDSASDSSDTTQKYIIPAKRHAIHDKPYRLMSVSEPMHIPESPTRDTRNMPQNVRSRTNDSRADRNLLWRSSDNIHSPSEGQNVHLTSSPSIPNSSMSTTQNTDVESRREHSSRDDTGRLDQSYVNAPNTSIRAGEPEEVERRPVRNRRPPDRFGEWVMEHVVEVDSRDVIYV